MNALELLDVSDASCEPLPAAISTLIEGALAAFDADRDTSRRYLLRASALLRAKGVAPAARQPDRRIIARKVGVNCRTKSQYLKPRERQNGRGHFEAPIVSLPQRVAG